MTESLLAKAIYTHLWTQIETASLPSNSDAHSHVAGQTFWAALEEALNTDIRTKILPSFLADEGTESYRIIFDDDKMHFNLGRGKAPACLKMSRHIRDNRIGPVCHEAVLSASGILVGCAFEKVGDKTKSCTTRIIREQMNKEMLFETFLPSGAEVLGTKQRTKDFPFVYGTKN
eukprot:scaffold33970_cov58-Attheya_sp.AAC.1